MRGQHHTKLSSTSTVMRTMRFVPKSAFLWELHVWEQVPFPPSLAAVIIWAQLKPPGPIYTFKGVYKPSPSCNSSTRRFPCLSLCPNVLQGGKGYPWGDNNILRGGFLILRRIFIQIVWTRGSDKRHLLQPLLLVCALPSQQRKGKQADQKSHVGKIMSLDCAGGTRYNTE